MANIGTRFIKYTVKIARFIYYKDQFNNLPMSFLNKVDKNHMNEVLDAIQSFLAGQNTESVRLSSERLKNYLKQPQSFSSLVYILTYGTDISILQMTGVLLNRIIEKTFSQLAKADQQCLQDLVLQKFEVIDEPRLEKIVSRLTGDILRQTKVAGWPKLNECIVKLRKQNPKKALMLLEQAISNFEPPAELVSYLFECLQVPDCVTHALRCLQVIVQNHELVEDSFLERLIENEYSFWTEDNMVQMLDILTAAAKKSGELKPKFASWVCKNIVANGTLSERVRASGVDFLFIASKKQENLLSKKNFMKDMIEAACQACAENAGPTNESSWFLQDVALWLLEGRITKMTNKHVFPTLFTTITKLINSQDPKRMCTGFIVMTGISQTCTDQMRSKLPNPIMNKWIPKALSHPNQEVRISAIRCLGYLCEFLEADIVDYRDLIITAMLKELANLDQKTAEIALVALDVLFEKMLTAEVEPYLLAATNALVGISSLHTSTAITKKSALSALVSLISTADTTFQPYVPLVLPMSLTLLNMEYKPEENQIHAANINLQAALLYAFCSPQSKIRNQYYMQYVQPNLPLIYSLLTKSGQYAEITQSCFCYFYKLATAIGSEFAPIFDQIIHRVIEVCEAQINIKSVSDDQNNEILSLDSESPIEGAAQVTVVDVDLKAAAIHTLGDMADACPNKFAPFMDKTIEILDNIKHFCVDTIRTQVIDCYTKLTTGIIKSHYGGQIPAYKQGLPCHERYPSNIEDFFNDQLLPLLFQYINDDFSYDVKMYACERLDDLIKQVGPALIDKKIPQVTQAIKGIIEKEQTMEDEQQMPMEIDQQDNIYQSISELIRRLTKVLRQGFIPSLQELIPIMIDQIKLNEESMQMSVQLVGLLGKIFQYLPQLVPIYGNTIVPRIHQLRTLNHQRLNRNASFCLGLMFQSSPSFMASYLEVSIHTLQDILQMSQQPATRQNALSSMCRIFYTLNPTLPLDTLIKTVVETMPFSGDILQERTALRFLVFMAKTHLDSLKPYLSCIFQIIQQDLKTPEKYKIKEPLLGQVVKLGQYISSQIGMH